MHIKETDLVKHEMDIVKKKGVLCLPLLKTHLPLCLIIKAMKIKSRLVLKHFVCNLNHVKYMEILSALRHV